MKTVLVTGYTRGIGKAIFDAFSENYKVFGISTKECDLENPDSIKSYLETLPDIDILINNAGIVTTTRFLDLSVEEWDRILNVNVRAPFIIIQHCLPEMSKNRYGRVINISSIAGGSYSKTSSCPYTSSKYALNGMTKQLSYEYQDVNVNFNVISPSPAYTDMLKQLPEETLRSLEEINPKKRLLYPEEVAKMCLFLVSTDADYINGEIINMNGGLV
jgi:3-oxoacyl-[acyl-carrier protein] reductase